MAKIDVIPFFDRGGRIDRDGNVTGLRGVLISGNAKNCNGIRYLCTTVRDTDGKYKRVMFHHMQAYAKFGKEFMKEGIQVRHLNENSLDNSWDNIAIGSQSDNMMDRPPEKRMRLALNATAGQRRKDWDKIDLDRESGMSYSELCDKHGVSKGTLAYRYSKTASHRRKTKI